MDVKEFYTPHFIHGSSKLKEGTVPTLSMNVIGAALFKLIYSCNVTVRQNQTNKLEF